MDDFLYAIDDKADSDMVLPLPPCWPTSRERDDRVLKRAGLLPLLSALATLFLYPRSDRFDMLDRAVVPDSSGSAPVGVDGRDEDRDNVDRIDDRMPPNDGRRPLLLEGRRNTGMDILWMVPVLADLTSMALRSTISGPLVSSRFILAKYFSSPEAESTGFR